MLRISRGGRRLSGECLLANSQFPAIVDSLKVVLRFWRRQATPSESSATSNLRSRQSTTRLISSVLKNERIQILSLADYESPYATKKSFQYQLFLPSIVHNPRIVFHTSRLKGMTASSSKPTTNLNKPLAFSTRETSLDIEWK